MHQRGGGFSPSLPKTVLATLGDALTELEGEDKVPLPTEGQPDSSKGHLHWDRRFRKVVAMFVYFRETNGVSRWMKPNELTSVMDYPEDRFAEMTEEQVTLLTHSESTPGKVIYSILYNISSLRECRPPEKGTKRKSDSIGGSNLDTYCKRLKLTDPRNSRTVSSGDREPEVTVLTDAFEFEESPIPGNVNM